MQISHAANEHETQPSGVGRRTILQGTAWTIPVIATAAVTPFSSASPCGQLYSGTLDVTTGDSTAPNFTNTSPTSGTGTVPLNGAPTGVAPIGLAVTSTFTSNYTPATLSPGIRNITPGTAGLALYQLRSGNNATAAFGQTVTFTFDRPVYDLQFDLRGFTWPADNSYHDTASISPAPTSTGTNGSQVSGDGSAASPWTAQVVQTNPSVSVANSVTGITFAGPIQTFTVHYWSTSPLTTNVPQAVYLSNMNFQAGC